MMGCLLPCPEEIILLTDEQITRWQGELRVVESPSEESRDFLSALNELEDLRARWRWEKAS